jgi:hypothetical protein
MGFWIIGTEHLKSQPREQSNRMPKFNLNINGVDVEAAEGREEWKGPLPAKGSYPAKLRLVQVKQIKGKNDNRLSIMAVLNTKGDPERNQYDGCPCWGGVNLTEQGIPYINQFLQSISTDESDYQKVKKAFYAGFVTDEKKVNVTKIGTKKINSPEGELDIMITVGHNTYNGVTSAKIASFLPPGSVSGDDDDDDVVEEDDDDDVETEEDDDSDGEVEDESVFEDEDADANA